MRSRTTAFNAELAGLLATYAGRPTPLTLLPQPRRGQGAASI